MYTHTYMHAQRMPPWPATACVSLSDALKVASDDAGSSEVRMLAWQPDALQLWRWKVTSRGGADAAGVMAPHAPAAAAAAAATGVDREWVDEPRYAVRVEPAAGAGRLSCAALAPDGSRMAAGIGSKLVVYQVLHAADLCVCKCGCRCRYTQAGGLSGAARGRRVCMYTHVCISTCVYVYVCICMSATYMCMYVCMYVCVCVYI